MTGVGDVSSGKYQCVCLHTSVVLSFWTCRIRPGQIFYEMDGIPLHLVPAAPAAPAALAASAVHADAAGPVHTCNPYAALST